MSGFSEKLCGGFYFSHLCRWDNTSNRSILSLLSPPPLSLLQKRLKAAEAESKLKQVYIPN